jgi:hypothetical protein
VGGVPPQLRVRQQPSGLLPLPCAILVCERLGVLYNSKGDYERSERCFRQAVDWFSKKFTVDDTDAMVYLYKNLLSLLEEVLVLQEK